MLDWFCIIRIILPIVSHRGRADLCVFDVHRNVRVGAGNRMKMIALLTAESPVTTIQMLFEGTQVFAASTSANVTRLLVLAHCICNRSATRREWFCWLNRLLRIPQLFGALSSQSMKVIRFVRFLCWKRFQLIIKGEPSLNLWNYFELWQRNGIKMSYLNVKTHFQNVAHLLCLGGLVECNTFVRFLFSNGSRILTTELFSILNMRLTDIFWWL